MDFKIRRETENDCRAVEELTREAFWNLYVPGCNEHFVTHKLRGCPAFVPELDLVAEADGVIIGNIVYCRASVVDSSGEAHEVLTFGPLCVLPELQKQGIGKALIDYSMKIAVDMGFKAVFIYGDPKYYRRFGFLSARKYKITASDGKYAAALMALPLYTHALDGISGRFEEGSAYEVDEKDAEKFDAAFPPKEKLITDTQKRFEFICGLRF